jgi:hypothetical protein
MRFLEIFYETILSLMYSYLAYQFSRMAFKLINSDELLFYFDFFTGGKSVTIYEGSSY